LHNDTKIYLRLNQNVGYNGELAKMFQVSPSTRKECPTNLGVMYL